MSQESEFDLIVIGSGPGGEGAAMNAAKHHQKVAMVERHVEVGGGCTHWGTIPSKALRHAVQTLHAIRQNPLLKDAHNALKLTFPQLLANANRVIETQVAARQRFYERNRIPIFPGHARFIDNNTVAVQSGTGATTLLQSKHFVIATGSRPYHPPELDFDHPRIVDSDSVLRYKDQPFSVTIYGAGVIGCEYASIFINLGAKVTLVNTQSRLLSFMDEEIAEALSYHLREQGCVIRHDEQYSGVTARSNDVLLELQSGRRIKSDILLWANGRTGNTQDMGLGTLGITPNSRGQLAVNGHYQTSIPNVYAVGDVAGPPALASAAYVQGAHAAQHMLTPDIAAHSLAMVPSGIYTIPEISSIGKDEQQLQAAKVPYEVGHCSFKNLARAQMTGEKVGMLKIIFNTQTFKILGVHCFGDGASEIVHIGQTVMASEELNDVRYFTRTTFNYPTMAEAYRTAAFNGLNRMS
jgi:NAD(P) transhydrogenase